LTAWNAPVTRDRSVSGMIAAKITPMVMSSTISPNPDTNSAANSMARTSGMAPCASGHSTSGAV
jgi:hypothetical protein